MGGAQSVVEAKGWCIRVQIAETKISLTSFPDIHTRHIHFLMSDIEEEELNERRAAVESLRNRCQTILQAAKDVQREHGFEGLYRYTNSLHAEVGFLDKVILDTLKKPTYQQCLLSSISYWSSQH